MEEEQQFGISEVLAVLKRRLWWILIPALIGPAIGIGLSFVVQPIYMSKAFVLIEQPKVPDKFVTQVSTDQLDTRLMTLQEQILSRSRLQPIIERLGLYKDKRGSMSMEDMVDRLRKSVDVKTITPEGSARVPSGFYITASADSPRTAQQVCAEILSMFMSENLKLREQRSEGTTDFLAGQLEESKRKLDQQDAQLAEFKGKYLGQLPTDEQRNLEMLTATRTRLETLNQELSQAQQQKIIQESALSQMNVRKASSSVGAPSPSDVQQELTTLQEQLAALQSRYTDDYPDVRKTKAQIRVLQSQVRAANAMPKAAPVTDDPVVDTPEMRQMRVALRLTEENIRSKRVEQTRLEGQVQTLQSRLQLSPVVEERYKALTRDYETALQFYNDLLSKKTQSEMSTDLERQQEGEQFGVMDAPDLPANPIFPNRLKFGFSGLGGGLALGVVLALLIEHRENFIRTEDDVVHFLALPVLISIPELKSERTKNAASPPRIRSNPHGQPSRRQQAKV